MSKKKPRERKKEEEKKLDQHLQSFWHCTQTQKPLHEYCPTAIKTTFSTKLVLDAKVQNSAS